MSLSKNMSVKKTLDTNNETISLTKPSNNPVVRINQDSDDNLQALFDSVLNPNDSKRPLQVPFRMRKLPNSFFNPPSQARPTNTSHSRTNSVDSAYDAGSQGSVNQTPTIGSTAIESTNAVLPPNPQGENKLTIFHSRAHSSPASLQQSYTVQAKSINSENAQCSQINSRTSFADNLTFPQIVERNAASSDADQRNLSAKPGVPNQAFHMKQRSYNVISPIQLYNELGDLPPGWEQARTNDGQIYYLNHNTKSTQWEDPRIQVKQNLLRANQQPVIQNETNQVSADISKITDSLGPLPEGWEQAFTESGDVYFINHVNRTTSWNDPRIPDFLQKSVKIAKPELHWINVRDVDKDREICKPKLEASGMNASAAPLQVDPFLSGDNHTRQESSDSGLSLSSNTFAINTNDFLPNIDDSMDCISDNDLNGMDCPEHLVSSLQIEDNICNEMFDDVNTLLNTPSTKPENLEWYKIN